MLSPGVPWIFVVILSASGYPYHYNNHNYNNYYQRQNSYNSHPDLELKRLKRCVNQWSPDMRMYNFMQNPSICGSSLVNDLSRITPQQLNCLMKILDGNEACNNWPQGVNNLSTFQTGMANLRPGSYFPLQHHPMGPHIPLNKPPVLRPQAIHPSLLEGWVSDEDTGDLAFGGYSQATQRVGPAPLTNLLQPNNGHRPNSGSLKAGSILVIVPGKDQLEEVQQVSAPQPLYNPPIPPVYDMSPMGFNPLSSVPLQDESEWNLYQPLSTPINPLNASPRMASNIMHGNPPIMDLNSINLNSLNGGNIPFNTAFQPSTRTSSRTQNIQNNPYIQNTGNRHSPLMNMNSAFTCGPWANAWTKGMFPYTGPCFNPFGSLLGQTFDQLRTATEAYEKVDEPEIEINQTTTCKKKGKDGKWVPCDPEDLERNLPALYNNNYGNANPTPVIPVWSEAMDKPAPQVGAGIQTQPLPVPAVAPNQAPSNTGGQPDAAVQRGGIMSGLSLSLLPQGSRTAGLNLGQSVTGAPFAVTPMTTPLTATMLPSAQANLQYTNRFAQSLGNLVTNGQNLILPSAQVNPQYTNRYAPSIESLATNGQNLILPPAQVNPQYTNRFAPSLGGLVTNGQINIGQQGGYPTNSNPYDQGLAGNYGVISDSSPHGGYNAAYAGINPSYTRLGLDQSIAGLPLDQVRPGTGMGLEREGRLFAGNTNNDILVSTERPGRSIAPPLQHESDRNNMNLIMEQGYAPMFIPSKAIPAIPMYSGFNTMRDPSRSMNTLPFGQPIYMPQMIPGGQPGQYPFFMRNPVPYGNPQNPISPGWVAMEIDRSTKPDATDIAKSESLENSNTEDTAEIQESTDETDDY